MDRYCCILGIILKSGQAKRRFVSLPLLCTRAQFHRNNFFPAIPISLLVTGKIHSVCSQPPAFPCREILSADQGSCLLTLLLACPQAKEKENTGKGQGHCPRRDSGLLSTWWQRWGTGVGQGAFKEAADVHEGQGQTSACPPRGCFLCERSQGLPHTRTSYFQHKSGTWEGFLLIVSQNLAYELIPSLVIVLVH